MIDRIICATAGLLAGFFAYAWWAEDILPPNMMMLGLIICLTVGAVIGVLIHKKFDINLEVSDD